MKFTKMQGCGNDYVYVNCFEEEIPDRSALAIRLSERHFGIGSDGVIYICPSDKADFTMDMYNLDGSRGRMCGNGIRCVGKYVFDHKMTDKTEISIETLAGIKYLTLHLDASGEKVESVTVDMGAPEFAAVKVPVDKNVIKKLAAENNYSLESIKENLDSDADNKENCIKEFPLIINNDKLNFTFVSMGNPHAVTFIDNTETLDINAYGPKTEFHEIFPERANVEFIKVVDGTHTEMRVWERGSAETFACGTGACASVVASYLNGLTDNKVSVKLLGGTLEIEYDYEHDRVLMTGPAVEVYNGNIDI
ncbi:MAG: diaminopimelate epimerase [Lachnospiraceae bacterium]|nr:diaminopimelate epimerase [Lachnospiraceae bacterium]